MPRTGTASLRLALSLLLDGPIYHMYQVIEKGTKEDVEFWSQACDKEKTSKEWQDFLKGFRGGVDYPPALFYK